MVREGETDLNARGIEVQDADLGANVTQDPELDAVVEGSVSDQIGGVGLKQLTRSTEMVATTCRTVCASWKNPGTEALPNGIPRYMTVNLDSPYLIPTLLGFTAEKSMRMLREREADVGFWLGSAVAAAAGVGLGELMPMYWTPTCWRSNCGFLGLTARTMTSTTARTRRARNEKSRKRQQQQPLKEAELEEEDDVVG